MAFLVDKQIKQSIKQNQILINPYDEKNVGPANYYLHLGGVLLEPERGQTVDFANPKKPSYKRVEITDEGYLLKPGAFVLGQTAEKLTLPNDILGYLDGRTTLARLGVSVHLGSALVLPGHSDSIITLEIFNAGNFNVKLQREMDIADISFMRADKPAEKGYGEVGDYAKQDEVMGAKF